MTGCYRAVVGLNAILPHGYDRNPQHPASSNLSLAQVHAALAYYYANQAEIDADLEAEDRETEALEREHRRAPQP